jgi:hypothetical protein
MRKNLKKFDTKKISRTLNLLPLDQGQTSQMPLELPPSIMLNQKRYIIKMFQKS